MWIEIALRDVLQRIAVEHPARLIQITTVPVAFVSDQRRDGGLVPGRALVFLLLSELP
ncbi:hypothetical protein TFLX_03338 [Thermoflexales bacterium]|nr:hypothetical protein TFLX_03338 [Thermoflexales bacterium]